MRACNSGFGARVHFSSRSNPPSKDARLSGCRWCRGLVRMLHDGLSPAGLHNFAKVLDLPGAYCAAALAASGAPDALAGAASTAGGGEWFLLDESVFHKNAIPDAGGYSYATCCHPYAQCLLFRISARSCGPDIVLPMAEEHYNECVFSAILQAIALDRAETVAALLTLFMCSYFPNLDHMWHRGRKATLPIQAGANRIAKDVAAQMWRVAGLCHSAAVVELLFDIGLGWHSLLRMDEQLRKQLAKGGRRTQYDSVEDWMTFAARSDWADALDVCFAMKARFECVAAIAEAVGENSASFVERFVQLYERVLDAQVTAAVIYRSVHGYHANRMDARIVLALLRLPHFDPRSQISRRQRRDLDRRVDRKDARHWNRRRSLHGVGGLTAMAARMRRGDGEARARLQDLCGPRAHDRPFARRAVLACISI
jgi:hypothetical protein